MGHLLTVGEKKHVSPQRLFIYRIALFTQQGGKQKIASNLECDSLTHTLRAAYWSSFVKAIRERTVCILRIFFFFGHMWSQSKDLSKQELPVHSALQTANKVSVKRWKKAKRAYSYHPQCVLPVVQYLLLLSPWQFEHNFFWYYSSIL